MRSMRNILSTALILLMSSWGASAEINVIPRPQEMRLVGQPIPLEKIKTEFPKEISILPVLWQETLQANGVSTTADRPAMTIRFLIPGSAESRKLVEAAGMDIGDQGYVIRRAGNDLQVAAGTSTGLVNGLYTLEQLVTGYGKGAVLQPAEIVDRPDLAVRGILYLPPEIDRLGYYRYLARYKLNYGCYYIDETATVTPEVGKVIADLAARGMKVVPVMSWFASQRFHYADDRYVKMVLDRVREIGEGGGKAVGMNFDDIPCELKYNEDKAKYKTLADAHIDLMKKVCEVARRYGMEVFFTPTIYWPVDAGRQGNSLNVQNAYQQAIVRGFPPEVKIFNTGESVENWRQVKKNFGSRKWVMFNNFFPNDMCERKIYYRPYQVLPKEANEVLLGVWVLGACGPTDIYAWYPNWISEAANTWNRRQPIGFREMFDKVYGPRFADRLSQMAELIGVAGRDGVCLGGTQLALRNQVLLGVRGAELQQRLKSTSQAVKILEEVKAEMTAASKEAAATKPKGFYQELPIEMLLENGRRLHALYLLSESIEKLQSEGLSEKPRKAAMEQAFKTVEAIDKIDADLGLKNIDIANARNFITLLKELAARSGESVGPRGENQKLTDVESFFKGRPLAQKFHKLGVTDEAVNPTAVWACHDGKTLYLAVECRSRKGAVIRARAKEHDEAVFMDDSVELFLCSDSKNLNCPYQIVINSNGAVMDKHGDDPAWNSGAEVKVQKSEDRWRAVIAIPFRTIGVNILQTDRVAWRMNICRNAISEEIKEKTAVTEYSTWIPVIGHSFYSPYSMILIRAE